MVIRKAQVGDANGIAQVHVQSWIETYRGLMPDDVLDNQSVERREAMWERVIAQRIDVHPVFVAIDEDEIVAFVSGGAARDVFEGYDSELYAIYALKKTHG